MSVSIPFLQAKHFRTGPRGAPVLWVVIHSAEIGESLAGAEALMKVCADNPRVASWHYAVDADSISQSVREEDIAFHAPGANLQGVGIELTGRARQTEAEWLDDFSQSMLLLCAELVASICARHKLPVRWVDRNGLLRKEAGITTHNEVSQAFKKSDHTDPGPNFPMGWFIEQVEFFASLNAQADTDPAPPPSENLK